MAQKTTIQLIDDLDGVSPATETVSFAIDGRTYEIDLSDQHAADLRAALAVYIDAGRRVGGASAKRRRPQTATGPTAEEIRNWAKSRKLKVSERGRISAEVRAAFEAAHQP